MALSIKTILVPIDFGEVSEHALASAVDLAKTLHASVHVMHVYQVPVYGFPDGAFLASPEVATRIADAAAAGLREIVKRFEGQGVPITHTLRQGNPPEEIVAFGADLPADLIVMGTHGRGMLGHALMGSVAERVVRKSLVPVLTMREAKKK